MTQRTIKFLEWNKIEYRLAPLWKRIFWTFILGEKAMRLNERYYNGKCIY